MSNPSTRGLQRAALLVAGGLSVQLYATLFWSPITFVAFMMVGVPLVLLGVGLFLVTVLRILKERNAL